ncbi:MAG: PIN domain-containing protein [Solirubrobacteraceae bacterium]
MKLLLDADVVIGALDANDAHHHEAHTLFESWNEHGDTRLISIVNLSEVLVAPAADATKLAAAREAIAALGISAHQPSETTAVGAARLRGRHPISLPDAYCLATAKQTGSTIVSFDDKLLRAASCEPGITVIDSP